MKKIFILISLSFAGLPQSKECRAGVLGQEHQNKVFPTVNPDSLVTVTAGKHYQRSKFYQLFWGKHYRDVWATPVQAPILNLQQEAGGLTPVKKGGSFQTKNLRMVNPEGKEFVIRSIDKDPSKALPSKLQNGLVGNLMRDQTSVIHPYGAFIVPTLARAAEIYHTNPKLVIIPDDPALGEFQQEFGHMLALVEERPQGEREEIESFGNSSQIISSRKAFSKMVGSGCYAVDSRQYLKSRLFDMWLGDWSRREDQWRWSTFTNGNQTIYKPIPRDRDHAFFLFNDGLITWFTSKIKTNYQTFGYQIKDVKGLNGSARPMDEYLLAMLSKEDFLAVAQEMKNQLSDAVIKEAIGVWPENIQALTGKEFEQKLISRRNQMPQVAEKYYNLISKYVSVTGSDRKDLFKIERLNNRETRISVHTLGKGDCGEIKLGERIFNTSKTKAVSIYGFGGNDEFIISGKVKNGIKVRIYDGEGQDVINDSSQVKSILKKTRIYNSPDGNTVSAGPKTKVIKNKYPLAHEYSGAGWLLLHRLHD
ncbi:hypothetical protein [Adhaeribacter aquaticus]|uniref:hypothetical protein n=1 Tax=Adhaeribacter aquaticus TaxID=299567 RepID=UPI00047E3697|nr:hypothetical protein [Adhaeribacter aquaticus]